MGDRVGKVGLRQMNLEGIFIILQEPAMDLLL